MAYGPKDIKQTIGQSLAITPKKQERAPLAPITKDTKSTPVVTSSKDLNTPVQENTRPVQAFGTKPQTLANYPNDVVRLDLFNAVDVYLGTNYRIPDFTIEGYKEDGNQSSISNDPSPNVSVLLNVEEDIQELGYIAGRYKPVYKFHRNILGSGDGHKIVVQEISANGLEVRVRPVLSTAFDNGSFLNQFESGLFITPKSEILSNLYLFKDANLFFPVFDYVQDKFTINSSPYSIIFKLSAPIPATIVVGDELWLAQEVSGDFLPQDEGTDKEGITLTPPDLKPKTLEIAGPNFDVLARVRTGFTTEYKDKDDLVGTETGSLNSVYYQLQDRITSSSLVENISINVDFRKYENFITYSSAESRLFNFKHKLRLIESYDARVASLTTDLNGLANSATSASNAGSANILTNIKRKSTVIGGFDAYERYLYYESASYETSSYGEFYPSTWPKSNSSKPFINLSISSSEAVEWYDGAISTASLYDNNNVDSLTRNVPAHIIENSDNDTFTTVVRLAGHYFDDIIPYIDEYTNRYNKSQELSAGLSKDLLYLVGQNLGFEFENGAAIDDLWNYTLGTDATGSVNTSYQTSTSDTMKETWKRLINNLPFLIRTKGTERCLRALINCFGIPETILRIKEYGGHEGGFDKKSDLVYDRFNYAFVAGYNGQTAGLPAQQIKVPWQPLSGSSKFAQTIEMRVRMADNQTKDQTIMEVPGKWKIQAFQSGSGNHIGVFLSGSGANQWATASVISSIYDTDTEDPYTDQDTRWHHVALRRENQTELSGSDQTYTLIVKTSRYNKVTSTTTASLFIDGNTSESYNGSFLTTGDLWIPGSGSYTLANSHSMDLLSGSVQEFRMWSSELQDGILDNHTLTPTSFQGNTDGVFTGSTSSFDSLLYRLTLGTDNKKTLNDNYPSTSSFNSQHPNQNLIQPSASFYNITSSAYFEVIEQNSLEWPDLGANRSVSTKIRIDNTTLAGNQLFKDSKVEKPLTDNNPPDNSKLGVFLSPTNEVNQDIAEQFGGISIDDFIGNPAQLGLDDYTDLQGLARVYSKKYKGTNKPNEYIRLLQHYNAALFKLIKQFVPYRANTQTGLLIEPTILERSKISTPPPVAEDLLLTASLDLSPEKIFPPKGEVEDPTNQPLSHYVAEATIGGDLADYLEIGGTAQELLPSQNTASIEIATVTSGVYGVVAETVPPIDVTGDPTGAYFEMEEGPAIDLGINGAGHNSRYEGSKYIYMTWQRNGLGTATDPYALKYVTASRYDDWEAINPTIITSRFSEQSSPDEAKYQKDIWSYKALEQLYPVAYGGIMTASINTILSSSADVDKNVWITNFGLRLSSSYSGTTPYASPLNTTVHWQMSGSRIGTDAASGGGPYNGLNFRNTTSGTFTGSVLLDSFFSEREGASTKDYRYKITGDVRTTPSGVGADHINIKLQYGKEGSSYTNSVGISNLNVTSADTSFEFITQADGPQLVITVEKKQGAAGHTTISNLRVQPLNYFESVQDYHLWNAKGMVNARYEGCKLTSTDYNVDSPDTVDGGPVITITEGGGKQLAVKPGKQAGTFAIR